MTNKKISVWLVTILRIVTGWHFLYEGIAKLFNPNWSSAAYLMESKWLFSGMFHRMISNNIGLQIVDFLNIWGLIIIGICLFIGVFTRIACITGALLLLMYYVANPPFMPSSIPSISHFYIINYNLIEAIVLIVIAFYPPDHLYGIQRYLVSVHLKRKEKKFPADDNITTENTANSRRELIKNLAVLPLFGGVLFGMAKKRGWLSFEEENLSARTDAVSSASLILGNVQSLKELKGQVPSGKIKNYTLSRIRNHVKR